MKSYKECDKISIGQSDIAALILVGCRNEEGVVSEPLHFGEDGEYHAYIIDCEEVEIGSHYKKVAIFHHWLKIYDDDSRVFYRLAREINIYRAGDFGCIIELKK